MESWLVFVRTVKEYIADSDTVVVEFDTEEGAFYNYLLQKNVAAFVKLARSIERSLKSYEEICMTGSIVEVKWTEDDLKGTEWSVGSYEAEVQSFDYDDDEVEVVYADEPGCVYRMALLPSIVSGHLCLKQTIL